MSCDIEQYQKLQNVGVAGRMSDSECSSGSLRPKTLEELDIRLGPLAIGWDLVVVKVPLYML